MFHRTTGKAASNEALASALTTIKAHAIHTAQKRSAFVRLAEADGVIYLHLADDAGTVISIDAAGWRICDDPSVRFLTTPNAMPLPMPERGGSLSELRNFINCPDDDAFALLNGWLSASFRGEGPFPLLVLTGQQGSAKSTTARILKSLLDPEKAGDRSAPRNTHDLAIWASSSRLLSCDNLSSFPDWLSDSFCRLATGGGFGTRTLYADDEETVFEAKRPAILNGIEDFVTRGDLLERSIILRHPAISDGQRWMESELWARFDIARPKLLGAILDRVAAGLKALPNVDRTNLPRMADAAAFAVACETGMGEPARYLDSYRNNQRESHQLALEGSVVAQAVIELMETRATWRGTPTEFFQAVTPAGNKPPLGWPRSASAFTGAIRRLAPALQKVYGITLSRNRDSGGNRNRSILIQRT